MVSNSTTDAGREPNVARSHKIYLGQINKIIMVDDRELPESRYTEIKRIGNDPVYRIKAGVKLKHIIEDVASEGEPINVVCLDEITYDLIGDLNGHGGRRLMRSLNSMNLEDSQTATMRRELEGVK